MIRLFNFFCTFTFTYFILNSCDGNDAKQRAFLGIVGGSEKSWLCRVVPPKEPVLV